VSRIFFDDFKVLFLSRRHLACFWPLAKTRESTNVAHNAIPFQLFRYVHFGEQMFGLYHDAVFVGRLFAGC
jgi:hypothetical protein